MRFNNRYAAGAALLIAVFGCAKRASRAPDQPPRPPARTLAREARPERVRVVEVRVADSVVRETSYCLASEDAQPCVDHFVLEREGAPEPVAVLRIVDTAVNVVTAPQERSAIVAQARDARSHATAEARDFNVDIPAVQDVLRRDYFYSVYRCRTTPAVAYARKLGSRVIGSLMFISTSVFEIERRSNLMIGLGFASKMQRWLTVALFTGNGEPKARSYAPDEASDVTWAVVTNVPASSHVVAGADLPRSMSFGSVRSICGTLYREFLKTSDEIWADQPSALSSEALTRSSYLPLAQMTLENNADFQLRSSLALSSELTERSLARGTTFQAYLLTADFMNLNRFPNYNYQADPFWSEIK